MRIEIEAEELIAILDYIKGQRGLIGNADDLAKAIKEKLPEKIKRLTETRDQCVKSVPISSNSLTDWKS